MSSSFIEGGLKLRDEQHFAWKIENFAAMLSLPKAVDAQGFEFRVGGNDPKIGSSWRIFLKTHKYQDSIGIYYKREVSDACQSIEDVYTECSCVVKNQNNEEVLSGVCKGSFGALKSLIKQAGLDRWIFKSKCEELLDADGCVTIHCTFKLFTKHAKRAICSTVQASLDQFHEKSKAEAQGLFAKLSEKNGSCENVKILTMDNVEIKAYKDILEVRSPVFEAMFRSNMKEATEGVIELQDFTADAVRILLHYIYTGELLPTWSNIDILLQLANAAEKYQFQDLLDFLDCILPSLCDVQTAKPLLRMAVQLRMKKAEDGILEFFRKNFEEKFENIKSGEEFLKALQNMSEDFAD